MHDRLDVSSRSIKMREMGVLWMEHDGKIGASEQDRIEAFTLNEHSRQRLQFLKLGGGSSFVAYDLAIDVTDAIDFF